MSGPAVPSRTRREPPCRRTVGESRWAGAGSGLIVDYDAQSASAGKIGDPGDPGGPSCGEFKRIDLDVRPALRTRRSGTFLAFPRTAMPGACWVVDVQ